MFREPQSLFQIFRKSIGSKRKELSDEHIADITRLFGQFLEADLATVLDAKGKPLTLTLSPKGRGDFDVPHGGKVKIVPIARAFKNSEFGYSTITVERPLRDEQGNIVLNTKGKNKGKPMADASLRDTENVPLSDDIETYFKREVLPHAPDAWIDHEKTKVGYEVPFNRHFYVFEPPRPLAEIDAELKQVTDRILTMIAGLSA